MTQTVVTKKYYLFFPKSETEKPIVYHLVKDYNLIINIFRAKVSPQEEGFLSLDITGTPEDIQRGLDYVKTFNVTISAMNKGMVWSQERCAQCGNCVAHCPTGALHIADAASRRIAYNENECIECMACLEHCPYDACAAAY
jgi:ferredoxin